VRNAPRTRRFAEWLLHAYPPSFRRAVGADFVDAVCDRLDATTGAGYWPFSGRLALLIDTVRNAPLEWAAMVIEFHRLRGAVREHASGERTMADKLLQDVRYAVRLWARRPAFAVIAILTLAIGIGANTAMFSIVNAVLLRPLPYAGANRLVAIWGRTASFPRGLLAYKEYEQIQKQTETLEAVGLYLGQSVNVTGADEPQRLVGVFASGSFFDVLGLKAERGRLFTEEESAPGTVKPVVVLSHQLWRQRFNEDPAAIGSTMTLNGIAVTVIGVMAPPFDRDTVPLNGYFINGDLFLPAAQFPAPRGLYGAGPVMLGVARMKERVDVATATAELDVIGKRLLNADPNAQAGRSLTGEPAQDVVVGTSRSALRLLFASVGVVLLIACVNVSHLLLARAIDRQKEIALRAALGASRTAVTRQLAVEASMMAVVAGGVGLVLGRWALEALAWLRPPAVPIPPHVPLDSSVLIFTLGTALGVAILCALAPALRASRPDISRVLQAGSHRASGAGQRTRDLLMLVEIAMSVALVALSTLLVQSLVAMQRVPLGFDQSNVFTLQFRLPQAKYSTPEQIARFFKSAIENVRAVPGVQSAALVRAVPFSGNGGMTGYVVAGRSVADPASMPQARFHLVTPEYFKTMRIPLLNGRDFTDRDDLQAPLVAVINQTFARREWPNEDPIGKHFTTPNTPGSVTVIGVVGDAKHYTATEPPVPQMYASHYQVPLIFCSLVARTSVPPESLTREIRKAIWAVDKDQPVWTVRSLESQVDDTQGQPRFLATLLAMFAIIALLLAGVGIYGVMSYGVAQRTHEIGIRLALGASSDRVLGEVVGRGMRLTFIAVAIGLTISIALARLAKTMLFGVGPADPAALSVAAVVLMIVATAACYVPARRAARVDPVVALAE
jgi:putative ABC transport system permease protein